ncbi:uncharacterized protein Asalp_43000 [Aeromonas salmonicida subsp. pectinolytica 34mel]|uniref:Uncharacterized protein n=1 Tax=Aeromonas salmonicida subsp. pectinolytica 34mel TaxID=1324960 RepID=A0A2D1QLV5_AERSA|nr:uncharacterized protein Asalp_43000 [Aeromonas salmonicida subsp. pectinolytica 34mel]
MISRWRSYFCALTHHTRESMASYGVSCSYKLHLVRLPPDQRQG